MNIIIFFYTVVYTKNNQASNSISIVNMDNIPVLEEEQKKPPYYKLKKSSIEDMINAIQKDITKVHERLDEFDEKLTEVHAVYKRIKEETNYKQQYVKTPLYGAKFHSVSQINDNNDEEEEEEDEDVLEEQQTKNCYCCYYGWL